MIGERRAAMPAGAVGGAARRRRRRGRRPARGPARRSRPSSAGRRPASARDLRVAVRAPGRRPAARAAASRTARRSTRPARPSSVPRVPSAALEVGAPDVAAVDDAGDEPLAGQPADGREAGRGCRGAPVKSSARPSTGASASTGSASPSPSKYEATSSFGRSVHAAEPRYAAGGGVQHRGGLVLHQRRLVELHPLGAGRPQLGEQLGVHAAAAGPAASAVETLRARRVRAWPAAGT